MFRNLHLEKKRHNTLVIAIGGNRNQRRAIKSIENFKINSMNMPKPLEEFQIACRKQEKSQVHRHPNPQTRSKKCLNIPTKPSSHLQITSNYHRMTQSTVHSMQNQLPQEIKNKIQKQIIPLIVENRLANQPSPLFYKFRKQDFIKLLQKIIFSFLEEDQNEQQMIYLNHVLKIIKNLILEARASSKNKKNQIFANVSIKIQPDQFKEYLNLRKNQLEIVCSKKEELIQQYSILEEKKMSIIQYNHKKLVQIEEENRQICSNLQKLQELRQIQTNINKEIEEKAHKLSVITEQSNKILHFVENQSKNKVVKMAGEHYKHIEGEIYEYAVYLQANQLANSLSYESIPMKYCNNTIISIEESLKVLNRNIIQNDAMPLQEKVKNMRNFVLKMYETYQKKDIEQQKLIEFKTKCIIKFVEKMKKWLDNWTLKQEYLVCLRKEFSADSSAFESKYESFFNATENGCPQENVESCKELYKIYLTLKQNYLMGNSFY